MNNNNNTEDTIEYPVRINRYLYLKNFCSRRKADELIERGSVKINGEKAVLGQKVNKNDEVQVSDAVKKQETSME